MPSILPKRARISVKGQHVGYQSLEQVASLQDYIVVRFYDPKVLLSVRIGRAVDSKDSTYIIQRLIANAAIQQDTIRRRLGQRLGLQRDSGHFRGGGDFRDSGDFRNSIDFRNSVDFRNKYYIIGKLPLIVPPSRSRGLANSQVFPYL